MECKSVLGKGLVLSATATELKKLDAARLFIASVFTPFGPVSPALLDACAKATEGLEEIHALLVDDEGGEEEEESGDAEQEADGGEELAAETETAGAEEGDANEELAEDEAEYEEETAEAPEEDAVSEFEEFDEDSIEGELTPDEEEAPEEPEPAPAPKAAPKPAPKPAPAAAPAAASKPTNALLAKKQELREKAEAAKSGKK